jgi:hypothetical protein|nr:MAG TPA: hypothetical protein [Caudoviricetes sp.]
MSEVFIPLGGAGGKNRGSTVYMDENYTHLKLGDTASMALPLPAGVYKKFKPERADDDLPESITSSGDGKNAVIVLEDKLLKKMTLEAFGIASITNFKLSMYGHKQVQLTWKNPSMGLRSGVRFVFKYDSLPINETDGFMFYDSADVHYETPLLEERELYVRAFNYVTVRDGRWYDDGAVSARITVSGISGSVTLSTGAGVWTVPDNVYKIRYIVVGQGGNGGQGNGYYVPGGGGGGGYFNSGYMNVTPGQNINWIIPSRIRVADGVIPSDVADYLINGAHLPQCDTVFGDIRVEHGRSPRMGTLYRDNLKRTHWGCGGNGGSGGAAYGGSHGANGSDGNGYVATLSGGSRTNRTTVTLDVTFGVGQHTSTTGFNGVLYSTGGDSGASGYTSRGGDGTDGLGNGGNGAAQRFTWNEYENGGKGGTGCIYIAWGSMMNDGS